MISKLGAIAFIAAMGFAYPTFAASPGPYGPGYTGGGSAGYNRHISTDYRLKHHKGAKHQAQQPSKAQ